MGGRGGSSGLSAGGPTGRAGSLAKLMGQISSLQSQYGQSWQYQSGYDDNGNPDLLKYQGQDDDKTANFLASTDRTVDFSQYDDGYQYHDIPLNRLLLRMGVNKGPTVLSDSDFNKYVQQTGQDVVYRGWSGQPAVDRFMNATHNHVGNGRYGDGYYFSPDLSTAKAYAGYGSNNITKMALSPNARVIKYSDLKAAMLKMSNKLQSSLHKTGTKGSGRTYGSNVGEAQAALKLGYNVVDVGGGYLYAITGDAFVVSKKIL